MPDNWGFVAAAYGLTAAVLLWYWRRLARKEREVKRTGHPRSEPGTRTPLQQDPASRTPLQHNRPGP
jgi:transposase-like protein